MERDSLIEAVWGEQQPKAARVSLHSYISNLRGIIGGERIRMEARSYCLEVASDSYDVLRFQRLLEDSGWLRETEPERAEAILEEALSLWRGPAFGDLAGIEGVRGEALRLEDLRLAAEEERIELQLLLRRDRDAVGNLRRLVREHPFEERLHGRLMLALYRSGRQAEALRTFTALRQSLIEEMGVEPSPPLWELQDQILQHDERLEWRPAPRVSLSPGESRRGVYRSRGERGGRRRAGIATVGGAFAVSALGAGLLLFASASEGTGGCFPPPPNLHSWWSGDGSTADLLGGRNGRLVDDAGFTEGIVGGAFSLDGDGDFVEIPHEPSLDFGVEDFSLDLWVRFESLEGEQVLAEKWVQRQEGESSGWTFTKLDDDSIAFVADDPERPEEASRSDPLSLIPQTWNHFAARRTDSVTEILVNGQVVAASRFVGPADLDSPASLKLGHRGGADDTPGARDERGMFLRGTIDEVHLVKGAALADSEVDAIVQAGTAGVCKERSSES